jgi:hypothetical protein
MDHPTDRSGRDQLPRARRRAHLEPLGEIDREDPPGFRLHPSDGVEKPATIHHARDMGEALHEALEREDMVGIL